MHDSTMGLGLLSIYLNLKWKQNDFLKHILIIYEMVKCKLPGDMVTQTASTARTFFFGAPKTHFDPGKTLAPLFYRWEQEFHVEWCASMRSENGPAIPLIVLFHSNTDTMTVISP